MTKTKHGTKIGWTHFPNYKGETWNPIVGCSHISPGCDNCYAEKWAARLASMGLEQYQEVSTRDDKGYFGRWNSKTYFVESALNKPTHWKKPRSIFVCSMSDLFHERTNEELINRVWMQIFNNPRHLFLILTKRPDQMLKWTRAAAYSKHWPIDEVWPDNVWLGVTVENADYDDRVEILLNIPAHHHFVSIEPMLGQVDIRPYLYSLVPPYKNLDWVICGGESGKYARPMQYKWADKLYLQCNRASVPFFFKQFGDNYINSYSKTTPLYPMLDVALKGKKQFPEVTNGLT